MIMTDLYRILYDPLSYLYPGRLTINPDSVITPRSRSAANALLIHHFRLSCDAFVPSPVENYWLTYWYSLPAATLLAGAIILREQLHRSGNARLLPRWAADFLLTVRPGLAQPPLSGSRPLTSADIIRAGFACLVRETTGLPVQFRQRLPLQFPEYVDDVQADSGAFFPPNLMILIVHYAKKNNLLLSAGHF